MSEIILASSSLLTVPSPRDEIHIRPGTVADIGFIDELQKRYTKNLGFMRTSWLEGKIARNEVLVAEGSGYTGQGSENADLSSLSPSPYPLTPLGYIIAQDHYLKRQELGIVYQLVVAPDRQRGFIGAALLKAQFDRSAYGCRLYCCWCAQDLEANQFWESMGFFPLAYRNGSEKKGKDGRDGKKGARVHIFWEKKIRGKDDAVNWWFPSKTDAGAMNADRLALPIPPGVNWRDLQPIEIPTIGEDHLLESPVKEKPRTVKPKVKIVRAPLTGGLRFAPLPTSRLEDSPKEKPKRVKKPKAKIDPKFIAASRELRDRYLEEVNEHGYRLESAGKYDLTKAIGKSPNRASTSSIETQVVPLLEAA